MFEAENRSGTKLKRRRVGVCGGRMKWNDQIIPIKPHTPTRRCFAFPPEVHRVKYRRMSQGTITSFAFPPEVHRVK
jgi:hypothetical protein